MGQPINELEINKLMGDQIWGTLIAVDEGKPYAVETSFATDDQCLYTGTKRGGRMNRCIEKNRAVSFKICDGDHRGHNYRAAIVESRAEILLNREDILYCLKIIYVKLGRSIEDIEKRADMFAAGDGSLRLYRIPLSNLGGISFGYR